MFQAKRDIRAHGMMFMHIWVWHIVWIWTCVHCSEQLSFPSFVTDIWFKISPIREVRLLISLSYINFEGIFTVWNKYINPYILGTSNALCQSLLWMFCLTGFILCIKQREIAKFKLLTSSFLFIHFQFPIPSGMKRKKQETIHHIPRLFCLDLLLLYLVCQNDGDVPSCPLLIIIFKITLLE